MREKTLIEKIRDRERRAIRGITAQTPPEPEPQETVKDSAVSSGTTSQNGFGKISASEIDFDESIYPRQKIMKGRVNALKDAISCGAVLPPITVTKESHRMVDGIHRIKANVELSGSCVELDCHFFDSEDDAAILAEAVRLNSDHGMPLNYYERMSAARKLSRLGFSEMELQGLTKIPIQKIKKWFNLDGRKSVAGHNFSVPGVRAAVNHISPSSAVSEAISHELKTVETKENCVALRLDDAPHILGFLINAIKANALPISLIPKLEELQKELANYLVSAIAQRKSETAESVLEGSHARTG